VKKKKNIGEYFCILLQMHCVTPRNIVFPRKVAFARKKLIHFFSISRTLHTDISQ